MKLTARFSALIVVLVLAIGAICFAGLRSLARLDGSLEQVVQKDMQRLLVITNVRKLFRSMVVLEREHLLENHSIDRLAMKKKMLATREDLAASLDRYQALATDEDDSPVTALRGAYTRWAVLDEQVIALSEAGKAEMAYTLAQTHASDPVSWETVIAGLVSRNEQRLEQQTTATRATYHTARRVLVGVALAAMLIAGLAGTLVFSGIKRNMTEIAGLNANLEQLVEVRTKALQQREQSIRLILDSTGEGLLTVSLDGQIQGERSRAIDAWFGAQGSRSALIWDFLGASDPTWCRDFAASFAQLAEDFLPFELSAAQMPAIVERGGVHYALSYRQVFEEGTFAQVLLVISDVSDRIKGERAERDAREQQEVLGHLLRDKSSFRDCVHICEKLIGDIAVPRNPEDLLHDLHTLKGNSAVYGFASIAEQCRKMEETLSYNAELTAAQLAELSSLWRARLESIQEYLSADAIDMLEIRESEHAAVLEGLRTRRDYEEILGSVEVWTWGRTAEFLTRLRAQSDRVAEKLGKHVAVHIEHNALRTPPGPLDAFWPTLIHVIRNAVDHGIESTEERAALGKSLNGQLQLTTRLDADRSLLVEVRDDGRGLDLEAIKAAARRNGLRSATMDDVVDALFTDGMTTRAEVTEISGRGVGMGAVRAACKSAGGTVSVATTPGEGTTFTFRFPPLPRRLSFAPTRLITPSRFPHHAA
jgi:HPt (histidine-containing phosphotransfer) domain-containing protein/CHASE3 domain sensor protein